tara:strand:+ start:173024 stop:173125 length:102 start_codon:yes stop_codon:yes gene_type:complete
MALFYLNIPFQFFYLKKKPAHWQAFGNYFLWRI